jgi:hypothetical protein
MAELWLLKNGLLPFDKAKELVDKMKKEERQMRK